MIEMLPPKLNVSINNRMRIHILAGAIHELAKACGVDLTDALNKGVIERDVLEKITLSFFDNTCPQPRGNIIFNIDWSRFELLAQTDDGTELYKGIDFSNGFCDALDKKILKVTETHVEKLKKKYDIKRVVCTYTYRDRYRTNSKVHDATRKYMNHVPSTTDLRATDKTFAKSLKVAFKGLDGILTIEYEID